MRGMSPEPSQRLPLYTPLRARPDWKTRLDALNHLDPVAWREALQNLPLTRVGVQTHWQISEPQIGSLSKQGRLLWVPDGEAWSAWPLLQHVGQQQTPLVCVVLAAQHRQGLLDWCRLTGWWVAMPASAQEASDLLARALTHAWPTLILLPSAWTGCAQTFSWGMIDAAVLDIALVATAEAYPLARAALPVLAKANIAAQAVCISSLSPLPEAWLQAVATVLCVDLCPLSEGLGGLVRLRMPSLRCGAVGADPGTGAAPMVSDVVAALRGA